MEVDPEETRLSFEHAVDRFGLHRARGRRTILCLLCRLYRISLGSEERLDLDWTRRSEVRRKGLSKRINLDDHYVW